MVSPIDQKWVLDGQTHQPQRILPRHKATPKAARSTVKTVGFALSQASRAAAAAEALLSALRTSEGNL